MTADWEEKRFVRLLAVRAVELASEEQAQATVNLYRATAMFAAVDETDCVAVAQAEEHIEVLTKRKRVADTTLSLARMELERCEE